MNTTKKFKEISKLLSYQDWRDWYLNTCDIEGTNPPAIDTRRTINCISLFSGIGGIDIACELCGIKTVAFCEMNPFGQRLLKQRWDNAYVVGKDETIENGIPIFEDVTKLSASCEEKKVILSYAVGENGTEEKIELENIQVIQGGFPCQPYSGLGKRRGHNDPRALFGHIIRLLKTIRPSWFVGENVTGLISLGLDGVLTKLDYIGYDTSTCSYPAASQNAPTMRHRVFIIGFNREYTRDKKIVANAESNVKTGEETIKTGLNKSDDETRNSIEGIGISIAGQENTEINNEKKITENASAVQGSNLETRQGNDRENDIELQDTGRNQEIVRPLSMCTGQSEISPEREVWTPCNTRVYNGKDFFEPEICRVRDGNGAKVSKDYINQIMAAGNAVNPIQIYPLIRYLKHIDDMLYEGDSRITLPEKIKEKAISIIEKFTSEQIEKLRKTFWVKAKKVKDDENKLYSANEVYQPYILYIHVKCDHKLCKKISALKSNMKQGCKPLCDNEDGKDIWVAATFHNFFKTSQVFTEIVLNNENAKYIDNQPLVDEIFKQIVEKDLCCDESAARTINIRNESGLRLGVESLCALGEIEYKEKVLDYYEQK